MYGLPRIGLLACGEPIRTGTFQTCLSSALVLHDKLKCLMIRLGCLYMFEAPNLFWALWRVVGPFVDPVTKAKIKFVYEKDMQEMTSNFSPEVGH